MSDVSTHGLMKSFNLNPELSHTLPASWYYDPAIFEREKEAIFFKTWHYVGHAENVDEPGSYTKPRGSPLLTTGTTSAVPLRGANFARR